MKIIAATLLLCLFIHSSTLAQGQGGMMGSGGGMGGYNQTKTKFVILLGPDLKPGEVPFLDAYEMARTHDPNVSSNFIPAESISIDMKTPLPTKSGVSVHVEYPPVLPNGQEISGLESKVRSEAIRYGITAVETKLVKTGDKVKVFLRVGLPNGILSGINLQKFAAAAEALDPENPTIEVFDERPINANSGFAMGMGMGMGHEMSASGGGMGTAGGGDGFDMGGYSGMGMSSGTNPGIESPVWAEASGTINDSDTVLSWSRGSAAARSSQTGDSWIEVKLTSDKMTVPTIGGKVCAFFCDNKAYAFSAKVGRWDVLTLVPPPVTLPSIVLDAQSARIKTEDDMHIFTAASGRWSSRSKAIADGSSQVPELPNLVASPALPASPSPTSNPLIPNGPSLEHALNESVIEKLVLHFKMATDDEAKATIKGQLLAEIADSFKLRQSMLSSEAELLVRKLALIEEQIQLRERNSQVIFKQRLKTLIGEAP